MTNKMFQAGNIVSIACFGFSLFIGGKVYSDNKRDQLSISRSNLSINVKIFDMNNIS